MTITIEQLRAQYAKNAAQLGEMVEAARIATNAGEGGPKGKRYRGYFYHQLVARYEATLKSANASDEELAPFLALLGGLGVK
jgi:hypothetical protein